MGRHPGVLRNTNENTCWNCEGYYFILFYSVLFCFITFFWLLIYPEQAIVLIENILAAFEMNEILYALRRHSAGLNAGRWDYIFSFIKKFSHEYV